MIARFSGATLGLLAFTVAALGGLWAGNSVTLTLSRAIGSLVIFCLLGLLLGGAAQVVVNHHAHQDEGTRGAVDGPPSDEPAAGSIPAVPRRGAEEHRRMDPAR